MIKIDEKHLEDIVFSSLQSDAGCKNLYDRGMLFTYPKFFSLFRQFNLKEYGIADIVRFVYGKGTVNIQVIELKVTEFHIDHLIQLGRYMSAFENIATNSFRNGYNKTTVTGRLIVSDFKSTDLNWITPMLYNVDLYVATYDIDGLKFKFRFPSQLTYPEADHAMGNFIDHKICRTEYMKAFRHFQNMEVFQNN